MKIKHNLFRLMAYTIGSCGWLFAVIYSASMKRYELAALDTANLLIFTWGAWSEYRTIVEEYGK